MNPYGLTWWCELCGGEGRATYNDARYFFSGAMFHRDLNETLGFITTAENIAAWLYASLKKKLPVSCIEVKETPTSNVIYRP